MSRKIEVVSRPANDPLLPEVLAPAALFLKRAEADGVLAGCEEAFIMGRRNGHTGIGIAAFLLVYLLVQPSKGLRPFAERHRQGLVRLARLIGLKSLPSAAAVSRALGRLEPHHATTFCDGVLTSIPGFADALQDPDVLHRDECGHGWHVLDVDPTVKAFRQRRLDSDEGRPEGVRLAPGCPGYTGQKRGELRIRSVPVAHSGLGCWVAYRMWATNPHMSVALAELVNQSLVVMSEAGVPPHQVIIRMDGEFGSAGCMQRTRACGVHFVTRLSRYALLRRSEVAQALDAAEWHSVQGDRPKEAAELGLFTLHPSEGSADQGGPPATVRVVVSRRLAGEREPHGVQRGRYVYELFATSLDPALWSSPSIVELYSGRASMENRLAQEDRELNLDRTFSYAPCGQALAVSLGLMIWNYLTILGGPSTQAELPEAPESGSWMDAALKTQPQTICPEPKAVDEPGELEVEPPAVEEPSKHAPFPDASASQKQELSAVLARSYADVLRARWSLDTQSATLTCPNGKTAFPFAVANPGLGRPRPQVLIRTETSACNGCPMRARCFNSNRPDVPKQVARAVEPAEAEKIRTFLKEHPPQRRIQPRPRKVRKTPTRKPRRSAVNLPLYRPLPPSPPRAAITRPKASPGDQRASARRLLERVRSVEIRLARHKRGRPVAPHNPRHRRITWHDRRARWRAPRPACVRFQVAPNLARSKSCPIARLLGSQ